MIFISKAYFEQTALFASRSFWYAESTVKCKKTDQNGGGQRIRFVSLHATPRPKLGERWGLIGEAGVPARSRCKRRAAVPQRNPRPMRWRPREPTTDGNELDTAPFCEMQHQTPVWDRCPHDFYCVVLYTPTSLIFLFLRLTSAPSFSFHALTTILFHADWIA